MDLNPRVLRALKEWGRGLLGFTSDHAVDGLTLAQGYIEGVDDGRGGRIEGLGVQDERTLLLLGMEIAWLFWLDDRFDRLAVDAGPEIDWPSLLAGGGAEPTPETQAFHLLRCQFARATGDEAAFLYWQAEAINLFRAYRQDALLSRGARSWAYAEYLQNGEYSVGVMHCLAALSLLYGLNFHVRVSGPRFRRAQRNLCLAMRLQNDLASADKERGEGDRANAVLLMEAILPAEKAYAFVLSERAAYERLLRQDLDALGPSDAFTRTATVMFAITQRLYDVARARYK